MEDQIYNPDNIFEEEEVILVRASSGKRLANYIIDSIFFNIVTYVLAYILAYIIPEAFYWYADDVLMYRIADMILSLVFYALLLSFLEALLKGKTIGKYITNTRAVNIDGSPITVGQAFGRGFSRAVPFCVFSALGNPCNPWQDRWTNTIVIDETRTQMSRI